MEWWVAWVVALGSLVSSGDLRWAGVLGDLDRVRAEAFATSQPDLLDHVYATGSAARDVDASIIRDYAIRGGRVIDADLTVLSCQIVHETDDRVSLDVVDRLGPARVVWADGTTRALPRDLPTRRAVTLVRVSDGWRIAN